ISSVKPFNKRKRTRFTKHSTHLPSVIATHFPVIGNVQFTLLIQHHFTRASVTNAIPIYDNIHSGRSTTDFSHSTSLDTSSEAKFSADTQSPPIQVHILSAASRTGWCVYK